MLDTYHIPFDTGSHKGLADVQIFNNPQTVNFTQWQTWRKPRGKSMIEILCIGGGSGGGGGHTAAAAAARGGGGGGGSSGTTRVEMPLWKLPDRLYIQVGAGGAGGIATQPGAAGLLSYVVVQPSPAAVPANTVCLSGAAAPGVGTAGTGAAAGGGGAGATIAVIASMAPIGGLGQFAMIAGQAGAAGGVQTGAVGGSNAISTTGVITMGGTGGGGTTSADFAGGLFSSINDCYLSEQRPATALAGSNAGSAGSTVWQPMFFFGGGGGGASNTGVGGAGGPGSYGSGGGGGGGGTTGGRGGDGGSGIVIITCW